MLIETADEPEDSNIFTADEPEDSNMFPHSPVHHNIQDFSEMIETQSVSKFELSSPIEESIVIDNEGE